MKRFIIFCFFLIFLNNLYGRQLIFDKDGNLIAPQLDKEYKLNVRYGVLFTPKFIGISIENTLKEVDTVLFNIGFTTKENYLFLSIGKSLVYKILSVEIGYGYSFNHHQPYSCVSFTIIRF